MKFLDSTGLHTLWTKIKDTFQEKLVSGTTIKTVNGNSLLGSGDIVISGGGTVSGDYLPLSGGILTGPVGINGTTSENCLNLSNTGVTISPLITTASSPKVQLDGDGLSIKQVTGTLTTGNTTSTLSINVRGITIEGATVTTDSSGNVTAFDTFATDGTTRTIERIDDSYITNDLK